MNAEIYWKLFMQTGAPEAYLLYTEQVKMEAGHVSDNSGHCPESHTVQ